MLSFASSYSACVLELLVSSRTALRLHTHNVNRFFFPLKEGRASLPATSTPFNCLLQENSLQLSLFQDSDGKGEKAHAQCIKCTCTRVVLSLLQPISAATRPALTAIIFFATQHWCCVATFAAGKAITKQVESESAQ
jgi:hypothetical protein